MERGFETSNRLETIWGVRLLDEGYTQIPNALTRNYRKLGVEHGEWGFICVLLTFKHDVRDPYPSRKTLAENLNCSERQIDKWVKSLREKGLLRIGERRNPTNKQWGATVYSLKPLIDACLKLIGEETFTESVDYEIKWEDESTGPEVRMGTGPEVRTKITSKKEKKKKKKENNNPQKVVVIPQKIGEFFSERNIPVTARVINNWLKIADEETILQAANEAMNKGKEIETLVGYIGGMLKKGYTPSVKVSGSRILTDKLPESVIWQQQMMAAANETSATSQAGGIDDYPDLKERLLRSRQQRKG